MLGGSGKMWCTQLIQFPEGQCPKKVYLVNKKHEGQLAVDAMNNSGGLEQVQWTFDNKILSSDVYKSQDDHNNFIHFDMGYCPQGVRIRYSDGDMKIRQLTFLAA